MPFWKVKRIAGRSGIQQQRADDFRAHVGRTGTPDQRDRRGLAADVDRNRIGVGRETAAAEAPLERRRRCCPGCG